MQLTKRIAACARENACQQAAWRAEPSQADTLGLAI